jgi:ribosomal protein S18 acetylase RimI-like enzyme
MSRPHWRPARTGDLPTIGAIAARVHPELPERQEVFAEKIGLYPDGCRVLVAGDEIAGYGLSHPWVLQRIPALDGFLHVLPDDADCLYLHDVAVLPDVRGRGVAREYVAIIDELARDSGIAALALVSVYATRPMWKHLGFRAVTADAGLSAKLSSYGAGATYMLRDLAGPGPEGLTRA